MNNIIIMYHYVRDDKKFKAFSTEEFRKQIECFSKTRRFITIRELLEEKPKDKTCILSFDDGVKDGFTNALPILEEYNAKATFFVPTIVLFKKEVLEVHKKHLLLAKLETEGFIEEFNNIADDLFKVENFGKRNEYDDELTSSLKYVLDTMNHEVSKDIVDKIFNKHFDEAEEFDKMYLNKKDLDYMESVGMEIGTHGCRHVHLGNVYFNDMQKDLTDAVEHYKKVFYKHPKVMSSPYGSYNIFTKRLAKKLGYSAGINITRKNNFDLMDPFDLNRYDCTCFYPRAKAWEL